MCLLKVKRNLNLVLKPNLGVENKQGGSMKVTNKQMLGWIKRNIEQRRLI